MNRPIRTLSVFCLVLFVALMVNITWVQFVKADDYNNHAGNRRVLEESFSRQRGAILAGKKAIARSVRSKDKYEWQRTYPVPQMYAPLTGYLSFQYGQTGLEHSQNALLSGDDERLFTNRLVDLMTNTEPAGGNVETTIDPAVQKAAWDGLTSLGAGVEASAVAIEPRTGRLLAMVSTPSYDPNALADHNIEATQKAWKRLTDRKLSPHQPMLNRATQTTLPPGSTFKLVTAAAALENLHMTPDSTLPGGTSLDVPQTDRDIHNENGMSCGGPQITLRTALEVSCNVAFGKLGIKLSASQLRGQAEKFGFGQDYLSDLRPLAKSRMPENLSVAYRALSAIGQYEVAATPLQMALVSAGIANDGVVMKPYLVDRVTSSSLDVIDQGDPEELSRAMTPEHADMLTDMMVSVVNNGTGTNAQIPGTEVAGKTGTAQSAPDRPPYAWFTSFAPAANPKIAVAIVVQKSNTERSEIAGGQLCAPVAKAMMEAALR